MDAAATVVTPVPSGMAQPMLLPPLREDLELLAASRQPDGSPAWNLYDPLRHQFFLIGWLEFEILSRWHLSDADAIADTISSETTLSVNAAQVLAVRQFLFANQLLTQSAAAPRPAAKLSGLLQGLVSNLLYRRFPLLEPDGFLAATEPWSRLFFTGGFWLFTLVTGILGFYLAARQWDTFWHSLSYFFTPVGFLTFSATVVLVKFFHELAHAYAAKRYGLAVPVIGAALIVLWPVFYTDTTDAWRLVDRRKRLVIGAAGVLVEIAVAVYATFLWSFLLPGPMKSVAFVLATTTWVTSLLVNLNPCMRFDGYYLLGDLWDIPNLQPRSFAVMRWRLRRLFLGTPELCPERLAPARLRMLSWYALSVWIYRLVVFTGIALMVYHLAFKLLGIILFAVEIWLFIVRPIFVEMRVWWRLRKTIGVNMHMLVSTLLFFVGVAALFMPLPVYVDVPAVYKAAVRMNIHAPKGGRIQEVKIAQGQQVRKGDLLAVLHSPELDYQVGQSQREVKKLQIELARATFGREQAERLRIVEQQLATAKTALNGYREQRNRLRVLAPGDGRLVEVADSLRPGRWISQDLQLALLVDDRRMIVEGYVRERDLSSLDVGDPGSFYPEVPELSKFPVRLEEIDRTNRQYLEELSLASVFGGEVAVRRDSQGRLATEEAVFRLELHPERQVVAADKVWRGTVRLVGRPESFFVKAWRRVRMVLVRESEF